jgi:hypothetical protein
VDVALAKERRHHETATIAAMLAEKVLTEEQRRHKTAAREKALADEAYKRCRASTQEKALADEAYERCLAATWEKALADEVNKRRRQVTAALEKALADEVNKQRRQVTAARENALANNAYERRYQELANVSPPPHRPTTYKDAVLCTMGGEPSREVFSRCTVVSPVNYGRRPIPDGMSPQPTSSSCWSPPWPPGSKSTGAPSLRAASSAPRPQ